MKLCLFCEPNIGPWALQANNALQTNRRVGYKHKPLEEVVDLEYFSTQHVKSGVGSNPTAAKFHFFHHENVFVS